MCGNRSDSLLCRPQTYERQFRIPEQRDGGLLQLLGDPSLPKQSPRNSLLPAHTEQTQHTLTQKFHQNQINPEWITSTAPPASPAHAPDSEQTRDLAGASRGSLLDPTQTLIQTTTQSPSPQRSLTPDLQLPVVTDASILNLTSLSRYSCLLMLDFWLPKKLFEIQNILPFFCSA